MVCHAAVLGSCAQCRKTDNGLLAFLSRGTLECLDRVRVHRNLVQGEVLFHQGEATSGLHCISKGLLALKAVNERGALALIGLAGAGDLVGYGAFLSHGAHSLTAEALVPTELCSIPVRTAHGLMMSDPQFAGALSRACLREAQSHRARMVAFAGHSNDARLCMVLAAMLSAAGRTGPRAEMVLPLSRQELAAALSIAPETLSRVVHRLTESGVFALEGRHLVVPSVARLQAAANGQHRPEIAGFMSRDVRQQQVANAAIGARRRAT